VKINLVLLHRLSAQKYHGCSSLTRCTHGFSANWVNFNRFSVTTSGLSGNCAYNQFPEPVMSSSKHPYGEIQVGCGDSVILRTVGRSALRHILKMVVVESNRGTLCAPSF